jgi:hypothetical protein
MSAFYIFENNLVARDLDARANASTHQLGAQAYFRDDTYGLLRLVRYKNTSGSTILKGAMVRQRAAGAMYEGEAGAASTPNVRQIGLSYNDVPDGYYGWAVVEGQYLMISNGSTTAGVGQKGVASGQMADGVIGTDELPVLALATNASAGTTNLCRIKL